MAHFYGTLRGNRGQASRLGTKESGLHTQAMAWGGMVQVQLYHKDGQDFALVELYDHPHNDGGRLRRVLYDGPVDPSQNADLRQPSRLDLKRPHPKVKHGLCTVCGHYGDDCEGQEEVTLEPRGY